MVCYAKNEFTKVMNAYKGLGLNVVGVDASDKFFTDLAGVSDPEEKRKIIGRDFVEVFKCRSQKDNRCQMVSARYYLSRPNREFEYYR